MQNALSNGTTRVCCVLGPRVDPKLSVARHSMSAMTTDRGERQLCWACPGGVAAEEVADFGQLVRELRVAAGWSQRELGERIGTTQSAVARLEAGDAQPRLGTLQKLAEAFDQDLHLYVRVQESA